MFILKMITVYKVILTLGILSTSATFGESYRILGIFPLNAPSHNVMFTALMKGLAKRGHQVDHITHFPVKNPPTGYKVVLNLNGTLKDIVNSFTIESTKTISGLGVVASVSGPFGNDICKLLALDKFQQFLKSLQNRPPYDVFITEAFGANCYMGIGHLLKIPVVALCSAMEYPWMSFIGNYDNLAVVPNAILTNFNGNNFWDRLTNVVTHYWMVHGFHALTEEAQTEYMRKYISADIPNIREVEKNIALTIVNTHPVIHGAKATTSSLIEASGLHIEENDDVPNEVLKKWLDSSQHGVVYFTFGSYVRIETLPADTIKDIYKSFAQLAPMRVLMRIIDKNSLLPGLPKNVKTMTWIPQQAVLAHKNIRVFLTHAGLMGCQEAIYHGVPMIGIPLFGDQSRIISALVEKKMAIRLDLDNITTVSLNEAFSEVLNNPQYRKNVKHYSKIFKDRPLSAMDTAVFWIEFIIRNGPEVLRSPGLEMPWWQTALIDVYGFIFLSLIIVFILISYITKRLFCKYFFTSTTKNILKEKSKVQ